MISPCAIEKLSIEAYSVTCTFVITLPTGSRGHAESHNGPYLLLMSSDLHRSALEKCSDRLGSPGLKASLCALSNGGTSQPIASSVHGKHPYRLGPRSHAEIHNGPYLFMMSSNLHRSALGQLSDRLGPLTANLKSALEGAFDLAACYRKVFYRGL